LLFTEQSTDLFLCDYIRSLHILFTQRYFLPVKRTDICTKNEQGRIIIDAKYYRRTLVNHYDREKIHSQNLYQLFSYLLNQQRIDCPDSFKTRGSLIYPDTGKEIDLEYWYNQHLIQIKTLNLNVNWKEIEERLRGVVWYFPGSGFILLGCNSFSNIVLRRLPNFQCTYQSLFSYFLEIHSIWTY